MDRAHFRGNRGNDGLETGIMEAAAVTLAWIVERGSLPVSRGSCACAQLRRARLAASARLWLGLTKTEKENRGCGRLGLSVFQTRCLSVK